MPSCIDAANNLGQYIPLAVPDTTTFPEVLDPPTPAADYYEIAPGPVPQADEFVACPRKGPCCAATCSSRPRPTRPGASASRCVTGLDGTGCDADHCATATQVLAVDDPQFLGPVIAATKDKPVRITFYNLLPTGQGGDLIIPTDSSLMGSGFVPAPGAS